MMPFPLNFWASSNTSPLCATCLNCSVNPPTAGGSDLPSTYVVNFTINGSSYNVTVTNETTSPCGSFPNGPLPCIYYGTFTYSGQTCCIMLTILNASDGVNNCQWAVYSDVPEGSAFGSMVAPEDCSADPPDTCVLPNSCPYDDGSYNNGIQNNTLTDVSVT